MSGSPQTGKKEKRKGKKGKREEWELGRDSLSLKKKELIRSV